MKTNKIPRWMKKALSETIGSGGLIPSSIFKTKDRLYYTYEGNSVNYYKTGEIAAIGVLPYNHYIAGKVGYTFRYSSEIKIPSHALKAKITYL